MKRSFFFCLFFVLTIFSTFTKGSNEKTEPTSELSLECKTSANEKNEETVETKNPEKIEKNPKMEKRSKLVDVAMKYLNTPYKYASNNSNGMDCSGLIYQSTLEALNYSLPRSSSQIAAFCKKLTKGDKPQIGDFLFFNTFGSGISHVGIYIGDNKFIHSASSGPATGVIISSLNEKYWASRFLFYGSIF